MKIRNYLLSGCLIAALCSCGTSQKENLNLTLSKDTLFDKVKGAWAGQILGCTYGGPTEFQYLSTMIPDSVVIPWGNGEIKKWFDGGGGLFRPRHIGQKLGNNVSVLCRLYMLAICMPAKIVYLFDSLIRHIDKRYSYLKGRTATAVF